MSPIAFGTPFDHDDADAILRSSDQVDFHVYKVILSASSPFFKSMFSLPQPDATSISEKQKPIVDLQENSKTIAALLTFIYPVVSVDTQPESLDDMVDTFAAAKKYDMAVVSQRLIQQFAKSKVVQGNPVVAFCVAYSHNIEEVARVAAKASLKHQMNLDNIGDNLQYINGAAFHQLYKFHRACSAAAAQAITGSHFTWISSSHQTWWDLAGPTVICMSGPCQGQRRQYKIGRGQSMCTWSAPPTYFEYITRAHVVLLEHPCREAVTNPVFLAPSYKGKACINCRLSLEGLPEFSRLLGDEVERRVSEVRHFLAYILNVSHSIEGQSRVAILTFSGLSVYVHV